jgi:hypothetical protein
MWWCLLTCAAVLGLLVPSARAKEGGDQYPNGAENWFAGSTPAPGFYYINYFGYYACQLKNSSGSNVMLNGGTPLAEATFDAFRFVDMTNIKILGADYGVHVIVPLVDQSIDLGGRNGVTSVGDTIINPFILGWHLHDWHVLTGVDIYLPTGSYNKNDPRVSVGANYYAFDPLFAFSYMPKSGWEASAKIMYNMKTTNDATNYHSGQEFHMDYQAGKHFGHWMFGATGYFLEQTTDDNINGQIVAASEGFWSAGRRGQVLAIGPSAGYTNKRNMTFMVDWQHESLVRNRFGGDKIWVKMVIPFASIFHGPIE